MLRIALFLVVSLVFSINGYAINKDAKKAVYILQIASNLSCSPLDVALISGKDKTQQVICFNNGAFAAVEVPAGEYSFGNVSCESANKDTLSFEQSLQALDSFSVDAGLAYFGGKLILKQIDVVQADTPAALDNCARGISRQRGDSGDDCRDGIGVTEEGKKQTVNIYAPLVAKEDVDRVRAAFNANESQLLYIPLIAEND